MQKPELIQGGFASLSLPERRRLLRATSVGITLHDPATFGRLDGPGEDPEAGRFIGVSFDHPSGIGPNSPLVLGLARLLVDHPGHDLDAVGQRQGQEWQRSEQDGVVRWTHPSGMTEVIVEPTLPDQMPPRR